MFHANEQQICPHVRACIFHARPLHMNIPWKSVHIPGVYMQWVSFSFRLWEKEERADETIEKYTFYPTCN